MSLERTFLWTFSNMIEQFKSLPPLQESLKSEYPTRNYMAFEVWRNFLKLIGKYFGNWCGLSESLADLQSVIGSQSFYSNESGNNIPTSKNCISQNTWSFKLKFGGHSEVQKKINQLGAQKTEIWSSKIGQKSSLFVQLLALCHK